MATWKDLCRVATTTSITLSGTQMIDGIGVIATERVLVKNQASAQNNGIYVVAAGPWSRATDANASSEIPGMQVPVSAGTINAYTIWSLSTQGSITLGTTPLGFSPRNQTFQKIADLRSVVSAEPAIVHVGMHTFANDGGGGDFQWDGSSTATDDNGTIIAPTGLATGRWKRRYAGVGTVVNLAWWGADTTGANQADAALTSAINVGAALIVLPKGTYRIGAASGTFTFPATTSVQFLTGAKLKPDSGKTVKMSRVLAQPTQHIFDIGAGGSISFAQSYTQNYPEPIVYVDWWGAVPDGGPGTGTNNAPFINAAIVAVASAVKWDGSSTGGVVRFGSASIYSVSDTINIKSSLGVYGIRLEGCEAGISGLSLTTRLMWTGVEPSASGTTGTSGGTLTVSGLGGISPAPAVGGWLIVSGAVNATNNGAFLITAYAGGVATLMNIDPITTTTPVSGAVAGDTVTATSVTRPVIRVWNSDCIINNIGIQNNGRPLYAAIDETKDTAGPGFNHCTNNLFEDVRVDGLAGPLVHGFVHGDNASNPGNPPYPYNCENTRWVHCGIAGGMATQVFCPNTFGQTKKCELISTSLNGLGPTSQSVGVFWRTGSVVLYQCDLGSHRLGVGAGNLEQLLLKECLSEGCARLVKTGAVFAGACVCNLEGGRYNAQLIPADGEFIQFYGAGTLNLDGVFIDQNSGLGAFRITALGSSTNPAHVTAKGCCFPNMAPFSSSGMALLEVINCTGTDTVTQLALAMPNARAVLGDAVSLGPGYYAGAPRVGWDSAGLRLNKGVVHRSIDYPPGVGEAAWADEATAKITTTNATSATLYSTPVFPGNSNHFIYSGVAIVEIVVTANWQDAGGGGGASWTLKRGFFMNPAHIASVMGSTTVLDSRGTNSGAPPSGWSVTLDTDGPNILVTVQNSNSSPFQVTNWTLTKCHVAIAA